MIPRRHLLSVFTAALAVTAAAPVADARRAPPAVQDLQYGEVLFHYYQRDYFAAMTRLLIADEQQALENHADEAELLLGGLQLSYGMQDAAADVFRRLLDANRPEPVRNRAWYYLAKLSYQRGELSDAWDALRRVEGRVDPDLRAEQQLLRALVEMELGNYAGAIEILESWKGARDWSAYARYNLAVALIHHGRTEDAVKLLDNVGRSKARSAETANLRDRANLAAGYALLQGEEPLDARRFLARVRLDGPYANEALLAYGWADAGRSEYRRALAPWLELRERSEDDPAVQEAMLAVPYALGELGSHGRSAALYEEAIYSYQSQAERLDRAMASVRRGELLTALADPMRGNGGGWLWRMEQAPQTEHLRDLAELLAGHRFQEALKNYRDLVFLADNLERWAASIDSFEAMLQTRRERYAAALPVVDAGLAAVDLPGLSQRRDALRTELERVRAGNDVDGLANAEEDDARRRLAAIGERLDALGDDERAQALRERHRFLSGVLHWQLNADHMQRRRQVDKGLSDVDGALEETAVAVDLLQGAREAALRGFEGYQQRIGDLRGRIAELRPVVAEARTRQGGYLNELAIQALNGQRKRLRAYVVQARFALAQIYDRASADDVVPGGEEAVR